MKKIYTILMITGGVLFSVSVKSQITNPYLDSTSIWYEIAYGAAQPAYNYKDYNKYFIDGDTIIAGNNYYKLYWNQIDSTWDFHTGNFLAVHYYNHVYLGSLREDSTKRFYMYQNSSERLFYDFNLYVGDTLPNINGNSGCSSSLITVTYIDTVYVGSRALKKFHLSSGKTMYEGIGASLGLFDSYALCSGTVIESGTCLNSYKKDLDSLYINCGSGTVWRSQSHTICAGQSLIVGTHTYSVSGTYQDTLTTVNTCDSIITNHLTVSTASNCVTAIAENNTETDISISPNPTTGVVKVVFNKLVNNTSIKIFNSTGQKVFEQNNINSNPLTIDISNQSSGMYILEVSQNGLVSRTKLIKE